jgi:exosortase A-associated hydrolase 2
MNAFFFGTEGRRLFGVYDPARGGGGTRAVVICQPWGQEYLRAHRAVRLLARMLASAGSHVLRFDYFGTGDSAGDMTGASLAQWASDVEMALEEVRDMVGATRVTLVGLRLGGTLAAQVAARRKKEVHGLVLWDPIVSGREYVQDLMRSHMRTGGRAPLPREAAHGGGHEVMGFPLTDAMSAEMQSLDLVPLVKEITRRTLVLVSHPERSHEGLRAGLAETGGTSGVENVAGEPPWLEVRDTGAGAVPVPVLQRIVTWLT